MQNQTTTRGAHAHHPAIPEEQLGNALVTGIALGAAGAYLALRIARRFK